MLGESAAFHSYPIWSNIQPHLYAGAQASVHDNSSHGNGRMMRLVKTAGLRRSPGKLSDDHRDTYTAALIDAGLNNTQAERVLGFFRTVKHTFSVDNFLLWLQLLESLGVQQPTEVLFKRPILLMRRADNAAAKAQATIACLHNNGLTDSEVVSVISTEPMILCVTVDTLGAVDALFRFEFGWDTAQINKLMLKSPLSFAAIPEKTLSKLAWFKSHGFTTAMLSKIFLSTPQLFRYSIDRNEANLSALRAFGLSQPQVISMVMQIPTLLSVLISGPTIQAKVQFFTIVMKLPITDLVSSPGYLIRSLSQKIGPRWTYWSLHRRCDWVFDREFDITLYHCL